MGDDAATRTQTHLRLAERLAALQFILRTGLNETFPLLEDCGRSTPSSARRSFRWLYRKEADGGLDSDKTHGR
jgi:hypothetical protein